MIRTWGESGKSWGREKQTQNLLYENNFLIKKEQVNFNYSLVLFLMHLYFLSHSQQV